ncbi:MAG: thioredoxin domain-containing protein [bacterium]|nr:thioredoxin domain-containing protein [bacterium]
MDNTSPKRSWTETVPPKTAMGLGAALGIGALGMVGFLVLLPGAIKEQPGAPAPTNAVANPAPTPTPEPQPSGPVDITVTADDHVRGNPDASVTIVEWSDFECLFCSRFHPTVAQALVEYPEDVRWVYRHFPLESIHPQARPAAEASECAAEQGKFWEYADALFQRQSELAPNFYKTLAGELKLDTEQFQECFSTRKYEGKVRGQESAGLAVGVQGTPGSFVNGIELGGAVPYSQLKTVIDQVRGQQ